MSKKILLPITLVLLIALSGCTAPSPSGSPTGTGNQSKNAGDSEIKNPDDSQIKTPEQSCRDSGGIAAISSCCKSAKDFPNTCLIGACGCSPENSHEIATCECGPGACFNGTACMAR